MRFGAIIKKHRETVLEAAEGSGDVLALITWFTFGTLLFVPPFMNLNWRVFAYAAASLTVIRMVPVFLSVAGLGLRTDTKLFVGWFGPRGLASIVFAVMVLSEDLPGGDTIVTTAACTILLSVVAHGLSAIPLVTSYSKRVGTAEI